MKGTSKTGMRYKEDNEMHMELEKFIDDLLERQRAAELSGKVTNDYVEKLVIQNCEQAKEIWQKETMIDEYIEEIKRIEEILKQKDHQQQEMLANIRLRELEADEMELEIRNWVIKVNNKEDDYGELLSQSKQQEEEIKRLERKLEWADSNLIDKMMKINRYGDLVDDLMKVISILIGRTEGNE